VKTRQFVWSRPDFIEEVRKNFVPVVSNDVEYRQHPEKHKLEYRLLMQMFQGQREGLHQGIYAVTSSGRMLGRLNAGWPDPDADTTLRLLRGALAEYRRMPRSERVLATPIDPKRDRLSVPSDMFRKPAGSLDLRVVKRSYPFPSMTSFDVRNPLYYSIDRLWYRQDELTGWVPSERRVGARAAVRGPVLERLVTLGHLVQSQSPWQASDIRRGDLTSTVTQVEGSRVTVRITGDLELKATTQWNQGSYRGNLIGSAVYDSAARRFERFELLSLGTHTQSPMQPNMHTGSPTSQVGSLITLNPLADADDRLPPTQWFYGYPRGWCNGS
jgi:hypothetical protein